MIGSTSTPFTNSPITATNRSPVVISEPTGTLPTNGVDPNAIFSPVHHSLPTIDFDVKPGGPLWDTFVFLVTKHIFAVNAFSNEHIMRQACMEIAHVLNVDKHPMGVSYNIKSTLIRRFYMIGQAARRQVHSAVERWIRHFDWPVSTFPLTCATSKYELYKHLMYHARFARTDYEEDGRMLQNPCLTQCLNYVMYKDKKTRKNFKHQELDNPVPKPLIVFIMVIIHFNLEKLAFKRHKGQNRVGSSRSRWSVFYPSTSWHRAEYKALINPSSKQGRQLQWNRIMHIVNEKLGPREESDDDTDSENLNEILGTTM